MDTLNHVLLILHLLGLTMGFSVTFGHLVLNGLLAKATPQEQAVLARFVPGISRVGDIGLALLWTTGLTMVYTKWFGFASMPATFHWKILFVVLLTITVGLVRMQSRKAMAGDAAAKARIQKIAPIASLCGLLALILAVVTFG